jgi:sphingolipid delta-4 desaturase
VALVAAQAAVAALLKDQSWPVLVLVAFCVGAVFDHALWVMIHEASHNLIFPRASWNTWAGMAANLPHVLPSSVAFQRYHLKHHAFQGVYELDADLPNRWEARLIGGSVLMKALWLLFFPVFQLLRPPRLREITLFDGWVVTNIVVQLAFDVAVFALLGPKALVYLLVSFLFSVGLHPLGARWIQEHYLVTPGQETSSYYGPMNWLAFNVGYHNEHHDFPSVPWNHLPAVRRIAPEAYDSLASYGSWTGLLFRFLFDRRLSLHSRVERSERGDRRVEADPVKASSIVPPASDAVGDGPRDPQAAPLR